MEKPELILCACYSHEHQFTFTKDEDDGEKTVYLTVHLTQRPFWKRVWYSLHYIFGHQCNYGAFDEVVLNDTHSKSFIEVGKFLEV